jgi:hypothetical protein
VQKILVVLAGGTQTPQPICIFLTHQNFSHAPNLSRPSSVLQLSKYVATDYLRISNGSELLRGVDGRSAEARRYRDLTEAFRLEFGLGSSEREMAAIRLAAALTVQSETLQAAIVRGTVLRIALILKYNGD